MTKAELNEKWDSLSARERDAWMQRVIFGYEMAEADHHFPDGTISDAYFARGISGNDGREYDAWIEFDLPCYTTEIGAAWEALRRLKNMDVGRDHLGQPGRYVKATITDSRLGVSVHIMGTTHSWRADAPTAPLAICKAALLVAEEVEG